MIINKNYFSELTKGKTSLVVVFWFWFVFISIAIEVFFEIIFMENNYTSDENYTEIFLYFLILIYSIFIFTIVFRTSNNYKGSKLWSFLSKLLVSLNLLSSISFFIEINKLHFFEDYEIEKEIESFKEKLPIEIDMNSTLVDIYKIDKSIHYKYQLNKVYLEDENLKKKFKKEIQDSLCEDQSSLDLLKKEYILNYQYINENKEDILNITTDKKICGESINDLEILKDVLKKEGII
jgi:hypothetical protein